MCSFILYMIVSDPLPPGDKAVPHSKTVRTKPNNQVRKESQVVPIRQSSVDSIDAYIEHLSFPLSYADRRLVGYALNAYFDKLVKEMYQEKEAIARKTAMTQQRPSTNTSSAHVKMKITEQETPWYKRLYQWIKCI